VKRRLTSEVRFELLEEGRLLGTRLRSFAAFLGPTRTAPWSPPWPSGRDRRRGRRGNPIAPLHCFPAAAPQGTGGSRRHRWSCPSMIWMKHVHHPSAGNLNNRSKRRREWPYRSVQRAGEIIEGRAHLSQRHGRCGRRLRRLPETRRAGRRCDAHGWRARTASISRRSVSRPPDGRVPLMAVFGARPRNAFRPVILSCRSVQQLSDRARAGLDSLLTLANDARSAVTCRVAVQVAPCW